MNPDRTPWSQFQSPIHCQCCSFTQCCSVTSLIDKRKVKKDKTPRILFSVGVLLLLFSENLSWLLTQTLCMYWLNPAPRSSLVGDEIKN